MEIPAKETEIDNKMECQALRETEKCTLVGECERERAREGEGERAPTLIGDSTSV